MNPLNHATLIAIATRKELQAARRFMRAEGVALIEALPQILSLSAAPNTIADLIAARLSQQQAQRQQHEAKQADSLARYRAKQQRYKVAPHAWQAWFDGSARPNPGKLAIGGLLLSPTGQRWELSLTAGEGDGTQAECLALLAILQCARQQQVAQLQVYGDSRIVIEALSGQGSRRGFVDLCEQAESLLRQFAWVELHWIPRHRNQTADALAERAFNSGLLIQRVYEDTT